jgi:hypothetical protein
VAAEAQYVRLFLEHAVGCILGSTAFICADSFDSNQRPIVCACDRNRQCACTVTEADWKESNAERVVLGGEVPCEHSSFLDQYCLCSRVMHGTYLCRRCRTHPCLA